MGRPSWDSRAVRALPWSQAAAACCGGGGIQLVFARACVSTGTRIREEADSEARNRKGRGSPRPSERRRGSMTSSAGARPEPEVLWPLWRSHVQNLRRQEPSIAGETPLGHVALSRQGSP